MHERGRKIPSGAIHAGENMRPGHWKENLASAMLILAVRSSSIYVQITVLSTLHIVIATTFCCVSGCVSCFPYLQQLKAVRRKISPWCVYCWGRDVEPLVLRCGGKPCRWRCPMQTSPLDFGRQRVLTIKISFERLWCKYGQKSLDLYYLSGIITFCFCEGNWNILYLFIFIGVFTPRKKTFVTTFSVDCAVKMNSDALTSKLAIYLPLLVDYSIGHTCSSWF